MTTDLRAHSSHVSDHTGHTGPVGGVAGVLRQGPYLPAVPTLAVLASPVDPVVSHEGRLKRTERPWDWGRAGTCTPLNSVHGKPSAVPCTEMKGTADFSPGSGARLNLNIHVEP